MAALRVSGCDDGFNRYCPGQDLLRGSKNEVNRSDIKVSKDYLQLLVSEIVLTESEVKFKGKYGALVGAVKFSAEKN